MIGVLGVTLLPAPTAWSTAAGCRIGRRWLGAGDCNDASLLSLLSTCQVMKARREENNTVEAPTILS